MSAAQPHRERCQALKKDGTPCTAPAVRNGRCVGHQDPADNAAWRKRGGAATSNAHRAAKLLPSRLRPVVERLETALLAACTGTLIGEDGGAAGTIDKDNAQLIAPLARVLLACLQAGELEERLRILEQQATDDGRFRDRLNRERGPIQWPTSPTGA